MKLQFTFSFKITLGFIGHEPFSPELITRNLSIVGNFLNSMTLSFSNHWPFLQRETHPTHIFRTSTSAPGQGRWKMVKNRDAKIIFVFVNLLSQGRTFENHSDQHLHLLHFSYNLNCWMKSILRKDCLEGIENITNVRLIVGIQMKREIKMLANVTFWWPLETGYL